MPGLEGVAANRYAFWLGSGISFGQVDGLKRVPRVIEFLRIQIVAAGPACRFKKALASSAVLRTRALPANDKFTQFQVCVNHLPAQ
jgi:hypothetical protein